MTKYYYFVAQYITKGSVMNYSCVVQDAEGCDHFLLNENREYVARRFGIKKTDVFITSVIEITKEEVELFKEGASL